MPKSVTPEKLTLEKSIERSNAKKENPDQMPKQNRKTRS